MGFFSKKKTADAVDSVLTESEIQKKLYGDFCAEGPHVPTSEREYPKENVPAPVLPKESSPEKEPVAADLFGASEDTRVEPQLSPSRAFPEQKQTAPLPRYVPLHDFEKKAVSSVPPVDGADPYARFRNNRSQQNKRDRVLGLWKSAVAGTKDFFEKISDPRQVVFRRFLYWGGAALVIFLLFWGVNSLNSQREEAMRTRYKLPGKIDAVEVPAAVVPPDVLEREVNLTPAPMTVKKTVPEPGVAAAGPARGPYVVQVVTYPEKKDADQIVEALKKLGQPAFTQESPRSNGRTFYVVLIGGFKAAAEARAQLEKFKSLEIAKPFQDAFVRTNRL